MVYIVGELKLSYALKLYIFGFEIFRVTLLFEYMHKQKLIYSGRTRTQDTVKRCERKHYGTSA